jgi:predicted nucleic acid-binding protein
MIKVLLDTDVILDFFFDREPYSKDAATILSLCESRTIEVYLTPVIICNVYYLLRKVATHTVIMTKLRLLMTIVGVLEVKKETILQALNSPFKDFEDALQNYAAESNQTINVIVTRNVKDYKKSALCVQTPHEFLKSIIGSNIS